METIPLIILEEHHEAFLAWHYAIQNNILNSTQNTLLHIDSHADMRLPSLRTPIHKLSLSLEEINKFTYDELSIGSFIAPAVYQKIFSSVYWITPNSRSTVHTKYKCLATHNHAGKQFILSPNTSSKPDYKLEQDKVYFTTHISSLDVPIEINQPIVLDIDLDFFSCETFTSVNQLEIAKTEFVKFKNDKYHFLRLKGSCYAVERDQSYYIIFLPNIDEREEASAKLSKNKILDRINSFSKFLTENKIKPKLIEICRSRVSGYTPKNQWKFIEENLLANLRMIYNIESIFLNKIFCNK